MPDHVHLLLQVLYKSDVHLDFYIENLKHEIATKYSNISGRTVNNNEIFELGYCDKPLYDNLSLDGLYQYIRFVCKGAFSLFRSDCLATPHSHARIASP